MQKNYEITKKDDQIFTEGLCRFGHPEIWLHLKKDDSVNNAEYLLRTIGDYMIHLDQSIRPGETFAFGSLTLRLGGGKNNALHISEYSPETQNYREGASSAMKLWEEQEKICRNNGVICSHPTADQMVVISKGVAEGLPVEAVRYPSPNHMSGWWITTNEYDGNLDKLKNQHLIHFLSSRPDLASFLGLPFGFRFDTRDGIKLWFDKNVANDFSATQ